MAAPARAAMPVAFPFTVDELIGALGRETMSKAARMAVAEPARSVEVTPDGTRMTAVVTSENAGRTRSSFSRKSYNQTIALSRNGTTFRVVGYCSCPLGKNCKHVGVALLTHLGQVGVKVAPPQADLDDDDLHDVDFDDMVRDLRMVVKPRATMQALVKSSPAALPKPSIPTVPAPVSAATQTWLTGLTSSAKPDQRKARRCLLYVLNRAEADANAGVWTVKLLSVGLTEEGHANLMDVRRVAPQDSHRLRAQGSRDLTDDDFEIVADLNWVGRNTKIGADIVLAPTPVARDVLNRMVATGRLHSGEPNSAPLRLGESVTASPKWLSLPDGRQRLTFSPKDGAPFDHVIAIDPPHYVRGDVIGPIGHGLPPSLALEVARSPSITRSEAAYVKMALLQAGLADAAPAAEAIDPQTGEVMATALVPASGPAVIRHVLPLPEAAQSVTTKRITPTIIARLFMGEVRIKERFRYHAPAELQAGAFRVPLVQLLFDYDGEIVAYGDPRPTLEKETPDSRDLVLMPRDRTTEDAAAHRLKSARLIPSAQAVFIVQGDPEAVFWLRPYSAVSPYDMLTELTVPDRYIGFSANEVPRLQKAGWQIRFDADYPYRIATGAAEWWADIGEGSSIDWFSFELGITFEGQKVSIIPQLASLISRLPPSLIALATKAGAEKQFAHDLGKLSLYFNLPDGRLLNVPADRIAPMLRGILELVGPRADALDGGKIKLHRAEAAALAGFADLTKVAWAASADRLIELGRSLKRGKAITQVKPPATFKASLRGYQADGLAWLDFLREAGFGGVLADDMGLGKTVQGLAFLAREKAQGRLTKPALIVAPTSVLPNWQAEAERFAPALKVLALRGSERKALFGDIAASDLVLTTYPLLLRDRDALLKHEFHAAILDEAQAIKNPKANVTVLAHQINARHRFALTGTPLENNLGEVWSLFEFLSPGLLGDETTFKRVFRTPIEKHGDPVAQGFLSRRLKPFMLRRTKAEVAKELPPKTEIIERIQLEGAQRDLYETVRALMETRVREEIDRKGLAKSHIVFLDALLKLRQVCCDPRLLKMDAAKKVRQSAKLERLMELLPEMVAEGRKILLFSQFTSMLDLIEVELKREKIAFVTLRGDTTDRAMPVREFQAGKVPVFLLSLKAGGTGLNLTAADTVIHYDPWWNPAVENQATDRAYRIGQDKPVFVHKLIVQDGIEDAIELLKKKKAALATALFEGKSDTPLKLTEDDIAVLFAPIGKEAKRGKR